MNQTFNYDVAGHVTQITDNALGQVTQYAYDASGNRIHEVTMQNGVVYQDNHLAYDALGRLRKVEDGNVSIVYDYDANGNRTHIHTQYENVGSGNASQDQYFAYDAMNRETVADAVDPNGDITQSQGHRMTYDLNGNRTSDTSIGAVMVNGQKSIGTVVQNYTYDSQNRLVMTTYNGTVIDQRQYDADGRVVLSGLSSGVSQSFFDTLGLSDQVQFNEYDAAGRLLFQRNYNANWQEQDNVTYTSYDAVGNVLQYRVNSVQGTAYTNTYTNTLVRYSGYEVAMESGTSTVLQPGQTNYQYDVDGNLIGVTDSTESANNRSFVNDVNGQILQKTQGSAVERELIANGNLVGTTGMGTDPNSASSGPNPTFVDLTNFDPTYRPINGSYPSPTPGAYTVSAGDTLQSIAQGAYGDSKLWYLIADANGLTSNNDLRVGQTVNIPNRVTDVHNSAGDFKPYDASEVVGSTTPNLPDPPAQSGGGGCGGVLGIIALVIVVVVTAICQQYYALPGEVSVEAGAGGLEATSFAGYVADAAEAAAADDAATQLIGDAIGTHQGFDVLETLEAAGTAAVTAGATGPVGGSSFAGEMLQAAMRNATTQAVRLALHQQKSFNWGEVALSAAAAPVAAEAGQLVGQGLSHFDLPGEFDQIVAGMASSATTQLATGGKVSLTSVVADAFGNELGDGAVAEAQNVGQQLQTLTQTQQAMTSMDEGMPGDFNGFDINATYAQMVDAFDNEFGDAALSQTQNAGQQQALTQALQSATPASGFDTDAAYAQLADAFSASAGSTSTNRGVLLASNELTEPGQPAVMTDVDVDGGAPLFTLPTVYVTPTRVWSDLPEIGGYGVGYDGAMQGVAPLRDAVDLDAAVFRSAMNDSMTESGMGATGDSFGLDFHPKDAITGLATDLSVWGVHQGGVMGNLALYSGAFFGGVADGMLPDTPGQAVFSIGAGAVAGPLLGKAISGLEGLAAASPLTSWLAEDVSAVAGRVATSLGQGVDDMIGNALDRFGFRMPVVESGPGPVRFQVSGGQANAAQYAQLKAEYASLDPGYAPGSAVENYVAGLETKVTPTSTNAGLFEVEQTGPLNYRIVGGGTAIDADGYQGTTLLDAKYVGDPSISPYVDGSKVPSFLSDKILAQQQYEFQRYQAVINDPAVPFDSLNVLTNEPGAVPYFQRLFDQYQIPGGVKVVPTDIPQVEPNVP